MFPNQQRTIIKYVCLISSWKTLSSLVQDNENNYTIGIWLVSSLYSFIYIKFVKYVEP